MSVPDGSSSSEAGSPAARHDLPGLTPLTAAPVDGPVTVVTPDPVELHRPRAMEDRDGRRTALEESPAPVADRGPDAPWATTFGAISLADSPTAITVRGEEVYIGGTFDGEM